MTQNRIKKEVILDRQANDACNNISTINSIGKLKKCVLKAIDDITDDLEHDIVGVSWFSVKLDISNYSLSSDTDLTYLRLENDDEYKSRLDFANRVDANALTSLKIQAKRLGYTLEKINE